MAIVKQLNKKTGITYVYESKSYWDREKKQPRNKKTLIGKIDPETGEVVPTGPKGRPRKEQPAPDPDEQTQKLEKMYQERILNLNQEIAARDAEIISLKKEVQSLQTSVSQMKEALNTIDSLAKEFADR